MGGKVTLEEVSPDDDGSGDRSNNLEPLAGDLPQGTEGSHEAGSKGRRGGKSGIDRNGDQDAPDNVSIDDADRSLFGSLPNSAGEPASDVDGRTGRNPGNFTIKDSFALAEGTPKKRVTANLAAIRTIQTIEREGRFTSAKEQATLAGYVGWGGLKTVFDSRETGKTNFWGTAQADLKEILPPNEYTEALKSVRNAHYTSRTLVKAIWEGMAIAGFDKGRVLEPTVGTGNFIGMQPDAMRAGSEWFAVELDPMTGQMASAIYPDAKVSAGVGLEDAPSQQAPSTPLSETLRSDWDRCDARRP